jgi:hypothetical protein
MVRRRLRWLALAALLAVPAAAGSADRRPPEQARARMEHHLREAEGLMGHFETILAGDCVRFDSAEDWTAYLDAELDRMVLLLAHLEQAWFEAKQTTDDEVRRAAKAPRRRREEARALVEKLDACAAQHEAAFSPMTLWERIEGQLPDRRAAIALPE